MSGAWAGALERRLITPEGVELRFRLASASERAGAFLLDLAIIVAALVALTIVALLLGAALVVGRAKGQVALEILGVVWLLGFFVLRSGYFTLFELGARAATPGKRAVGVRVISRDGGRLTGEAVLARNALREIEAFLPITILMAGAAAGDPADGLTVLAALIWSGCLLLLPLFNRDRLRAGDMVAGSWVIKTPRPALLPDMSAEARQSPVLAFTAEQLDAYGVKELELLEGLLRRVDMRAATLVAQRIRARIGWTPRAGEGDLDFLTAYYAALRGRLEQRLLYGRRRKDKFDVG